MAHGIKYRIQYYRLRSKGLTTIDILKRDYSGAITILLGGASPFESSFEGTPNNIYEPTMGSGAVINIINTTPLSLLEFYTADPQEWKIQVWDGVTDTDSDASSDAGGKLRWQGFISAEIFREGYSNPIASEMSIQCNDGMALLDKIAYKSTDIYTGRQTNGEIISNILSKLELTFNLVITSNDIQVTDTDTNLFTDLELFNENFLDEGDEPKTCRWVLESIIGGLGLVMFFRGDTIFIIDPINLHDTSKGKSYDPDDWATEAAYPVGGYLDISDQDIQWGKTGSLLDIVPAYSEVLVKYDPYNFTDLTYSFNNPDNWETEGTFTDMTTYQVNTNVEFLGWVFDSIGGMEIGIRDSTYSEAQYALYFTNSNGETSYTFTRGVIVQDDDLHLRLTMSVFIQTKLDNVNIFDAGVTHDVTRLLIPFAVKINGQYWSGTVNYNSSEANKWQQFWVTDTNDIKADYATSTINDKWVTVSEDIPIWTNEAVGGDILTGPITIEFKDNLYTQFSNQILPGNEPFFSNTSDSETNSFGDAGITWVRHNDTTIRITIVGLKTHANISAAHILLDDSSSDNITGITATDGGGGIAVTGVWHEIDNTPHNFSSIVAETTCTLVSYDTSTDTIIYDVMTSGTPYFTSAFDHFESGSCTANYSYDYLTFHVFIKDIKLEVLNSRSRNNIGNNGVESKGVLSTNLTGKEPFIINTYCGIGEYGCSRGAFKSDKVMDLQGNSGINIPGLYRDVNSTLYDSSDLILQSFMSQYKQPREKLIGRLNTYDQELDLRTKLLKDTNHRPDKAFYIYKGTYFDREEMIDIEAVEIVETREIVA